MQFLKKLSIKSLMFFLLVIVFCAFLATAISVNTSNERVKVTSSFVEHTYDVMITIEQTIQQIVNMETGYRGFLLTGQKNFLEPYESGKTDVKKLTNRLIKLTADNPSQTRIFNRVVELLDKWQKDVLEFGISLRLTNDVDGVKAFVSQQKGKLYVDELRTLLSKASDAESSLLKVRDDEQNQSMSNLITTTFIFAALGCLVSFAFLHIINNSIQSNISEVSLAIERLAHGELKKISVTPSKNEFFDLKNSFNTSIDRLSSLVHGLADSSNSTSSAAEELSVVMNTSSQNAQHELAQIEEISAAISQLSSTSREVSHNAAQAEEEARRAIENVTSGNNALSQSISLTEIINESVSTTAKMIEDLKDSVLNIGEVTTVISSISEQTNLLALNAAIEAARAGEHGRGFAVVADEVRVLATKTQESTEKIQGIILTLQEKSEEANKNMSSNVTLIQDSVELSELVRASFDDISQSVQSISDINALVATASTQQHSVTEDIAKNTTTTFDLVHENVAAVNQTLQASKDLAVLSERQSEELSFFKLG